MYCVVVLRGCDSQLPVFGQIRLNVSQSKLLNMNDTGSLPKCSVLNVQLNFSNVEIYFWSFKMDLPYSLCECIHQNTSNSGIDATFDFETCHILFLDHFKISFTWKDHDVVNGHDQ